MSQQTQQPKKDKQQDEKGRSAALNRSARYGHAAAKQQAVSSFGINGGVVFDPDAPFDIRCRVGVYEDVVLLRASVARRKAGATHMVVRSLKVRGSGNSWNEAFDEARKNRQEDRR